MKKRSLWRKLITLLQVALRFAQQHSSSMDAMKFTYTTRHDESFGGETILQIIPVGSLYQVTLTSCVGDLVLERHTWLASYGWHSNGHLIEIGGNRYCIFNPLQKTVLIEEHKSSGMAAISLYTQKYAP